MNDKQVLAEGKYLRLVKTGNWEYAERRRVNGIVGIAAVTDDGKLLLVEQYRPPVGSRVIELPAGLSGDVSGREHEDLAEAARRELEEETGYSAESMTFLCEGPPSAGTTSEIITIYLAERLTKVGDGGGDHDEEITVHAVPLGEAHHWLVSRRSQRVMVDLRIYTALFFLR